MIQKIRTKLSYRYPISSQRNNSVSHWSNTCAYRTLSKSPANQKQNHISWIRLFQILTSQILPHTVD